MAELSITKTVVAGLCVIAAGGCILARREGWGLLLLVAFLIAA